MKRKYHMFFSYLLPVSGRSYFCVLARFDIRLNFCIRVFALLSFSITFSRAGICVSRLFNLPLAPIAITYS